MPKVPEVLPRWENGVRGVSGCGFWRGGAYAGAGEYGRFPLFFCPLGRFQGGLRGTDRSNRKRGSGWGLGILLGLLSLGSEFRIGLREIDRLIRTNGSGLGLEVLFGLSSLGSGFL